MTGIAADDVNSSLHKRRVEYTAESSGRARARNVKLFGGR